MNRIGLMAGAMALAVAGCATNGTTQKETPEVRPIAWTRPADTSVVEVAAIDAMDGEALTEKRTFAAEGFTLPYRFHKPAACAENVRYPLVLFLHGAGERGDDNTATLVHGVVPLCKYAMKHGDAFVVAPQCPENCQWVNKDFGAKTMKRPEAPSRELAAVMALVKEIAAEYPVDCSRIYVTGISMGGFGSWDIVARMRGFFAAMMPICGGVDESTAKDYADGANLGIRFYHGSADNAVSVGFSRRMDAALTEAGVAHTYTEYPDVNHDSWTRTYANDEILAWLFGCRRQAWRVLAK